MKPEIKQVIVMRGDLKTSNGQKIRKGKAMSQASHASLGALLNNPWQLIVYLFLYVGLNMIAHGIVDFFTSRLYHYFYDRKNMKMYFMTLGFDQLTHASFLLITLYAFSAEIL